MAKGLNLSVEYDQLAQYIEDVELDIEDVELGARDVVPIRLRQLGEVAKAHPLFAALRRPGEEARAHGGSKDDHAALIQLALLGLSPSQARRIRRRCARWKVRGRCGARRIALPAMAEALLTCGRDAQRTGVWMGRHPRTILEAMGLIAPVKGPSANPFGRMVSRAIGEGSQP